MAFKKTKASSLSTDTAEALFRDLHGKKIQGLLAHQADILREYQDSALDDADVALQGPTGSGKTLVGVLLAEWRRRRFGERVVYLCPTVQLVHQVATEANTKYGIKVTAFTGTKHSYGASDKTAYLAGDTVAITTYSSLFNSNPYFDDPQLIILDDAHAAENYISKAWSLRVDRHAAAPTYELLASMVAPWIGEVAYARIRTYPDDPLERTWVDQLPSTVLSEHHDELAAFFDAHASATDDIKYAWRMLKGHLHACHLYFSPREFLLRPLIPPTTSHAPFANAKQRVYMSATLGEGGDLERLTGRRTIRRLKLPKGWDAQGVGRRFFIFGESALTESQRRNLVAEMTRRAGRILALVPDDLSGQSLREWFTNDLGIPAFDAKQLQDSKDVFTQAPLAAAVLANRYDGIDFPEGECRLLVMQGLPSSTNLQERFFVERLGAIALLNDRILTRVTQAFGRCTRSATDYAAVVVLGEALHKYLLTSDRRKFMHPELQAEIEFGIDQSRDGSVDEFLENFDSFLAQNDEWAAANEEIIARRSDRRSAAFPGSEDLRNAVAHEVAYTNALWQADFEGALEAARQVLTSLNAPELRGYRALWHYLAATAAHHAAKRGATSLAAVARENMRQAAAAAQGIPWLRDAARAIEPNDMTEKIVASLRLGRAVERIEANLLRFGILNDRSFDAAERRIWEGLAGSDTAAFERSHAELGQLLGFESGHGSSDASPDVWWTIDGDLTIVFEDHSGGQTTTSLNANKARQAASHPNWIRTNVPLAKRAAVIPVLISPISTVDRDAHPHLSDVRFWELGAFRDWAKHALATIRRIRRTLSEAGDVMWRQAAADELNEAGASPAGIEANLAVRASSLPVR